MSSSLSCAACKNTIDLGTLFGDRFYSCPKCRRAFHYGCLAGGGIFSDPLCPRCGQSVDSEHVNSGGLFT